MMSKLKNPQSHAPIFRPKLLSLVIASLLTPAWLQAAPAANELPSGGQIVQGSGAITQSGNVLNVQQNTSKMITNWETFNVGSQGTVNFIQQQRSDVILNRVTSGDPSQIHGQINAKGNVIIANPAGVLFGASSRVDVGGLIAAGQNLSDQDFIDGQLNFEQMSAAGQVINQGQIHTREGGYVVLAGAQVSNSGEIHAPEGQIALLAGEQTRLEVTAGGLIGVRVDGETANATVQNSGALVAEGGRVLIQSRQAAGALNAAINQTGIVRANTLATGARGQIVIDGGQGDVQLAGQIEARGADAGQMGGQISATAGQVTVSGSLDVSGTAGGGEIYIGGGWQGKDPAIAEATRVEVQSGAVLRADATDNGDGGEVVLWSSELTRHDGEISARGAGEGHGGRVETSSRGALGVTGHVDVSAESGQGGLWLLDPENIYIRTTGQTYTDGNAATGNVDVQASSIETALNAGTSVMLTATNNIEVFANIAKTTGGSATLTFDAGHDIILHTGVNITSSENGNRLHLNFGTPSTTSGKVEIFGQLSTNGGDINFYKDTYLRNAAPISTKITQNVAAGNTSGHLTFYQNTYLGSGTYAVVISAQGSDSGGIFNNLGGNIEFKGSVTSVAPQLSSTDPSLQTFSPQALTLDNTGQTGEGVLAGKFIFADNLGSQNAPLRSLNFLGAQFIDFAGAEIHLSNTSGNVITASNNFSGHPTLRLLSEAVNIHVRGGNVSGLTAGFTDYRQETFNITSAFNGDQTLSIHSDRSIKISNVTLDGRTEDGVLNLVLNPNAADGSGAGAVIINNSEIYSNGGLVSMGSAGRYAIGVAGDTDGSDGIRLNNTRIETAGGNLTLFGQAPSTGTDTSGAGVRITGANTFLNTLSGLMHIRGQVLTQTASGNKDGVIIGEGVTGRATLTSSSGNILIEGDASAVTENTGGNRYVGILLANRALIKTESGDITLIGQGGGGNSLDIEQNHGIRLQDNDTSILSQSGDIWLQGRSGGRLDDQGENSYGIYATGNNIYVGRDASKSAATGNILFIADSMEFVNTSSTRLQVSADGHLLIRPDDLNTNIELGNAGSRPMQGTSKTLYLGEDWFNGGPNSIFLSAPLVTAQQGVDSTRQTLTLQGNAGGEFTLNLGGTLTGPISFSNNDASLAAAMQTAVRELSGFEQTTVTSQGAGTFQITFRDAGNQTVSFTERVTAGVERTGFAGITLGREDLAGKVTVNATTTFRDDVTFLVGDFNPVYDARMVVNAGLTVNRQPNTQSAGSLSIRSTGTSTTDLALVAKGVITAAQLQLTGGGHFVATGLNRIGKLAAEVAGDITLFNGQSLELGSISSTFVQNVSLEAMTAAITLTPETISTNGVQASTLDLDVRSTTLGQVADITQTQNLDADKVALIARDGRIVQQGTALIEADQVYLSSTTGVSQLHGGNLIGRLAGLFSADSGLELNNAQALTLDSVSYFRRVADSATLSRNGELDNTASVTQTLQGLKAQDSTLVLKVMGDLGQAGTDIHLNEYPGSAIQAANLLLEVTNGDVSFENKLNQVDLLSAHLLSEDQHLTFFNAGPLTLGRVADVSSELIDSGSQDGIQTRAGGNIYIATEQGTLTVARDVTAGSNGTDKHGFIDLRAGGLTSDLLINPDEGATASIRSLTSTETGAGQIQLLAGRSILTTYGNAETAAITTTGSILLRAGDAIGGAGDGADGSVFERIELAGAPVIAAQAGSGGIWLRKLGSTELEVGSVNLVNADRELGVAIAAGSLEGLKTLEGGDITLTTQGGTLKVTENIMASGAGYVDLRTQGAILIDAAQIASGTGQLQLIAGGNITTTNDADMTPALKTEGKVLLISGGQLGSRTNPLALEGATHLSTQSAQSQFITHQGADLNITPVLAINAGSTLDMTFGQALDLSNPINGLEAGENFVLDLVVEDALNITGRIQALGNGVVSLTAASLQQLLSSGSEILTGLLRVESTEGAVALNNPANNITLLAGLSAQGFSYVNAEGFQVGAILDGSLMRGALIGVQAAGDLSLTARSEDLEVIEAVISTEKVTLSALQGAVLASAAPIQAQGLRVLAQDSSVLNHAENRVEHLAAEISGQGEALTFVNSQAFSVAEVLGTLGIRTQGGAVTLSSTQGDLLLAQQVHTGSREQGSVFLTASDGSVRRSSEAGQITTRALGVSARGDVLLAQPENPRNTDAATLFRATNAHQVSTLAGEAGGQFVYAGLGSLSVGSVKGLEGVDAASVWLRTQQDLTLTQAVKASTAAKHGVVLAAGNLFYNQTGLGQSAIQTPASHWLIYDRAVDNYSARMAGLVPDFRLFSTRYDAYRPSQVVQFGNGYLTGTPIVDPEQYLRVVGGQSRDSSAGSGSQPIHAQDWISLSSDLALSLEALLETNPNLIYGMDLSTLPARSGYATLVSAGYSQDSLLAQPQITLFTDEMFRTPLADLIGSAELRSITLADGSPLPEWLQVIGYGRSMRLQGTLPEGTAPFSLRLEMVNPDSGELQVLELLIQTQEKEIHQVEA